MQPKWEQGWIFTYLPLESNISNWSKTAYLKTQVDMLFFTIKHCQNFTFMKGHGAGVTVGNCMRMDLFFVFFGGWGGAWFCIFSTFLSFHSLFFCLLFRILYTRPFEPCLIRVGGAALRRFNQTFLVRKFDHFWLLWKPFVPFLCMLENLFSYYYYPAYYCIKWYWIWGKIACINLALRVVQQ